MPMTQSSAMTDFDPEDCLCQVKVVPEDKRIDFLEVRLAPKDGKARWTTVLRFHKDCPIHGVKEVTDA